MEKQKSASRYLLTTLSTILVLTALVLVGLNALQIVQNGGFSNVKSSYADGYNAARAKYKDLCPLLSTGSHFFTGLVQSNNGTSLVIVQRTLDTDPRVDGVKNERTITITSATKIQKLVQKDPIQFSNELQAYAKDPSKGSAPVPSSIVQLKMSDIQAGQSVYIESMQDVRLLETISATVIRLL